MKKSFFQKSVACIAMSLGAVAVLAMAPMSSAAAANTVVELIVVVEVPINATVADAIAAGTPKAKKECAKYGYKDAFYLKPLVFVKPIRHHTMYRVTMHYQCR